MAGPAQKVLVVDEEPDLVLLCRPNLEAAGHEVASAAADGTVDLRVRDRGIGIGIAEEDRERVFERFYRATDGSRRQLPGTGIGLAIVKEFAEAQGGRVSVDPAPERGTVFTVTLQTASG